MLEGEQREKRERECVRRKGEKSRERDERPVEGEWEGRDVNEEKRKMPPFQLSYSSNEMLTVEGSNRSKCMKPELVN